MPGDGGINRTFRTTTGLLIGYARVSTNDQDLTAQKNALAACRDGDTLVVTKLDCLPRSLRDAKDIVDELTRREVKLSIGGSVHDPLIPSAGSSSTSWPWSWSSKQT